MTIIRSFKWSIVYRDKGLRPRRASAGGCNVDHRRGDGGPGRAGLPGRPPGAWLRLRAHQPTRGATVVELAAHLGVTKQAASQLTAQLFERGFVVREPDPRDGRSQVLRLTERGWACTGAAEQAGAATIAEWQQRIGAEQMTALSHALQALGLTGPLRPAW